MEVKVLIISYQGIYDGQNLELANTPDQIGSAFDQGFSCMVDVWKTEDSLMVGTENSLIPVTDEYLIGNRFWLNCQTEQAYEYLISQPRTRYPNVFKFPDTATENQPTETTSGKIIVPGNQPIDSSSIVFLPELIDKGLLSTVKLQCYGICSIYCTFIKRMRNEGQWY